MQKKFSLLALLLTFSGCADAPPPAPEPTPAVVAAPQVSQQTVQAWLDKAKFDMLKGDFASAAQDYVSLIQVAPTNVEARLGLAEAYRLAGEYDKAFSIYTDLLKADPKMLAAKEGGALTLIAKGDYDNSVGLLDEVIKADPHRPEALNGMGVLFTTRNLQPDAQKYFNEALVGSPLNPKYLTNYGLSQALQGKYKDASAMLAYSANAAVLGSYERKRADMSAALVHAAAGHPEDALALAGAYYGGSNYKNAFGLYAKLAGNKKLAAQYLHAALTNGRPYYSDWDNVPAAAAR